MGHGAHRMPCEYTALRCGGLGVGRFAAAAHGLKRAPKRAHTMSHNTRTRANTHASGGVAPTTHARILTACTHALLLQAPGPHPDTQAPMFTINFKARDELQAAVDKESDLLWQLVKIHDTYLGHVYPCLHVEETNHAILRREEHIPQEVCGSPFGYSAQRYCAACQEGGRVPGGGARRHPCPGASKGC